MLAYEQARAALAKFDSLIPEGCSFRAGIPFAFKPGLRFARHLGFRECGLRRARALMVELRRNPGDGIL